MVQGDEGASAHVIKKGVKSVVKQRQEVLHAGPAPARGNGFVEGVVPCRAEGGEVALAKARDGRRVYEHFRHGQQLYAVQLLCGPLRRRIEGADGL
jgi:hypothetical protein